MKMCIISGSAPYVFIIPIIPPETASILSRKVKGWCSTLILILPIIMYSRLMVDLIKFLLVVYMKSRILFVLVIIDPMFQLKNIT